VYDEFERKPYEISAAQTYYPAEHAAAGSTLHVIRVLRVGFIEFRILHIGQSGTTLSFGVDILM
jgi:hypothetical protein